MSEIKSLTLTGTAETLLITLYIRALESQRPDALIKDEQAEALFRKIPDNGFYDFGRMKSLHLSEANKLVIILRNREFDRYTRDFLVHHLQMSTAQIKFRTRWGIWHGQELESWGRQGTGGSIRLLDEWGYFDDPTPRLGPIRWLSPIEALARTFRIYHFQLGKAAA